MQSYPLNLAENASGRTFPTVADLFVYESGQATPSTSDTRIIVKPDSGGEIVLRPGQRFRTPEKASNWNVRAFDTTAKIDGMLVIGLGEFDDANTLNTFKLDGTFSNTVTVDNQPGQEVPVTLAGTTITNTNEQRVPVSLDPAQVLNTSDTTVTYTNSYASSGNLAINATAQIVAPAANTNGIILKVCKLKASSSSQGTISVVAKATAPANVSDGDVILMGHAGTEPTVSEITKQVLIPAGKGLWVICDATTSSAYKQALYTVL